MAVFRSLLVPLKAVVMNLLSIGAAYGLVIAMFQWGWMKGLIGIGGGGPSSLHPDDDVRHRLRLSMDYEVFLLSRIKEETTAPRQRQRGGRRPGHDRPGHHRRRRDHGRRVRRFLLEDDRVIKLFGVGLAVACCSTPPSCGCCSCRPRWNCSATELVAAALARSDPAKHRRRGPRRRHPREHRGGRAGRAGRGATRAGHRRVASSPAVGSTKRSATIARWSRPARRAPSRGGGGRR